MAEVNNQWLGEIDMGAGLLQESILSPVLYNVYNMRLSQDTKKKVHWTEYL